MPRGVRERVGDAGDFRIPAEIPDQPTDDPRFADLSERGRWAVTYALFDIPVIPIWPPSDIDVCSCPKGAACGKNVGKHPMTQHWATPHGFLDATTVAIIVAGWWRKAKTLGIDPNVAIVPPLGMLGIDIDNLEQARQTLGDAISGLRGAPTCRTGRNEGYHTYFLIPDGASIHMNAGFGGGETKGDGGGYLIAPPSLHKSGTTYRWSITGPLTYLPERLVALLSNTKTEPPVASLIVLKDGGGFHVPDTIGEGQRYETIRNLIASYRSRGVTDREEVWLVVHGMVMPRCDPPLSEIDFKDRFDRVWEYDERNPGRIPTKVTAAKTEQEIDDEIDALLIDESEATESPTSDDWLVRDLIRPGSLGILSSVEGLGKSYLRVELALLLAHGVGKFMDWPDYEILKQRKVILFDMENGKDQEYSRSSKVLDALGLSRADLYGHYRRMSFAGVSLADPDGMVTTEKVIAKHLPDLVIIDTAGTLVGDEWGKDFKKSIAFLKQLTAAYGTAFLCVVHHTKPPRDARNPAAGVGNNRITDVMGHWSRPADYVLQMEEIYEDDTRVNLRVRKRVPNTRLVLGKEDGRWIAKDVVGRATGKVMAAMGVASGLTKKKGPASDTLHLVLWAHVAGLSQVECHTQLGVSKASWHRWTNSLVDKHFLNPDRSPTEAGEHLCESVFKGEDPRAGTLGLEEDDD
jgi:hypothetical protein